MTLSELYRKARSDFRNAKIDSPQYDAMCLIEHFFGVNRAELVVKGDKSPKAEIEAEFLTAVEKRSSGYPLQYILGEWTFMDIPLFVGEGVLIPRDDTEILVREAIKRVRGVENPKIIDLCSGTGAVAIALAKAYPKAEILAVELSDKAFSYLKENLKRNACENIKAIKGDIFRLYEEFSASEFDAVLSNPPYIKTDIIATLAKEVQHEPRLALDGGKDGMIFYNSIIENWESKVKRNGFIGVEIGEDLTNEIVELFKENNFEDVYVLKDMAGLDRAVFGTVH